MSRRKYAQFPVEPLLKYFRLNHPEYKGLSTDKLYELPAPIIYEVLGVQRTSWERHAKRGTILEDTADKIATHLGLHPVQLWPDWYEATARASEKAA